MDEQSQVQGSSHNVQSASEVHGASFAGFFVVIADEPADEPDEAEG